jgi:hypothetical protein
VRSADREREAPRLGWRSALALLAAALWLSSLWSLPTDP